MEKKPRHPASPPDIERRTRLHPFQLVCVPVIFILPLVLGALGVFGKTRTRAHAEAGLIRISVDYPTRFRFKQLDRVTITVTNEGVLRIDSVLLSLDTTYANRFSTVRATPSFQKPYTLVLKDLGPGESSLAIIEIQAEHHGVHEGGLRIQAADTLRIPLRTIVFP